MPPHAASARSRGDNVLWMVQERSKGFNHGILARLEEVLVPMPRIAHPRIRIVCPRADVQ